MAANVDFLNGEQVIAGKSIPKIALYIGGAIMLFSTGLLGRKTYRRTRRSYRAYRSRRRSRRR